MSKISLVIISVFASIASLASANDAVTQQCLNTAKASFDASVSSLTLQYRKGMTICNRFSVESFQYEVCAGEQSDNFNAARDNAKTAFEADVVACN